MIVVNTPGLKGSPAAAADAQRWIERLEYAQTGKISPTMPGPSSAPQVGP